MTDIITVDQLKTFPQWVGHKNKIPMNPHDGGAASTNNPATWGTAAQAWGAKCRYRWDGIGYVFSLKTPVVGIDFDNVFNGGQLRSDVQQVVDCLNSYTEISPSGRGLHILVAGTIPHSLKTESIEMYNELRYFTVTGKQYKSIGHIAPRQKELDAVFVTYGGDFEENPLPDVQPARGDASERDVRAALSVLPTYGDYNTFWLPVLMAVHSVFPDERGVAMCEAWSPGKKGEIRRKFRSFDRTAKDAVKIGTLFHLAKQHGWQPPQQQKRAYNQRGDLRGML